jgi:hypothetical protein
MEYVPPVKPSLSAFYLDQFVAPEARRPLPPCPLLPLLFGCELPHQGVSDSTLPIDVSRYNTLAEQFLDLPPAHHIAIGMGEILAWMHWAFGIDARDVELVLGGRDVIDSTPPQCWVLDFSAVSRVNLNIQLMTSATGGSSTRLNISGRATQ